MLAYPIEVSRHDGQFVVEWPDIPECVTVGDTREEALANAPTALETVLAALIDHRRPIPRASQALGRPIVTPGPLAAMKVELYIAMREQGMKQADLARRLGWPAPQVARLLDLMHHSRVDQVEAAMKVLGRRFLVSTVTADRAA